MNRELLVIPTGNSARMICDAEGNPTPKVIWYKNDKILRRIKGESSTISPYQYNIVIKSLIPVDSGIYTCNVSNKWGYINKTYTLDVTGNYCGG